MSTEHLYEHEVDAYGRETFVHKARASNSTKSRPNQGRRRGKSPQSVNGLHKRRRRKMSW